MSFLYFGTFKTAELKQQLRRGKYVFSVMINLKLREKTIIPLDKALVMPYFNYCGAVWGNINKGLADKLQKLQNRAARILTFSNNDIRSSVLLDELGWEKPRICKT